MWKNAIHEKIKDANADPDAATIFISKNCAKIGPKRAKCSGERGDEKGKEKKTPSPPLFSGSSVSPLLGQKIIMPPKSEAKLPVAAKNNINNFWRTTTGTTTTATTATTPTTTATSRMCKWKALSMCCRSHRPHLLASVASFIIINNIGQSDLSRRLDRFGIDSSIQFWRTVTMRMDDVWLIGICEDGQEEIANIAE
ncbi:hypothetical protein ACLKA7_005278 [Drosophila subpalustris]